MCIFIVNPSWVNVYYVNPYLLIKLFEKLNIKVKRMKHSSIMQNWHPSDSYSRTHSDFRNAQKHCVDAFSRFSEILVDYPGLVHQSKEDEFH